MTRRVTTDYREQPCRSALNRVSGMPFEWSLNPYVGCAHRCTFCYVRSFERRADRPSDDGYGRSVRVKVNIAGQLRRELARPSWTRATVHIGTATDPYQPAEGTYRLTRACLAALVDFRTPAAVITRGPLVVRDADLLASLGARAGAAVTMSIPTLDDAVWRTTEPGTPHPRARLRAIERLAAAGVRCGVSVMPILPGLSDEPGTLSEVIRGARDSGASYVFGGMLRLQPGTREHFLEALARDWPEQAERYRTIYARRSGMSRAEAAPTMRVIEGLRRRWQLTDAPVITARSGPPPCEQMALHLA